MKKFLSLFFAFAWTMIAFAATETTVYFSAPEKWIGENTVKLNVELQKNVENGWSQMEMTKSTLTYNGNPVYIGTYTDVEDGVYTMQFQLWDAEDKWKGQDEVYASESLIAVAEYNGKMYVHGTGWTAAPTENGGDNPGQGEGGEQTEVTYTLVGSPLIFDSSWDTEDTGNDMVKGEDGNYTLTKENVHLSNPTYEYKMVVNHKWGAGQIPADNSNQSITIETAGSYNVTFTLDMKDYVLTAVPQLITADAGGQTETAYTMVGDADIFGSSWTITDTNNDMVKGADGNYTLVKANVHLNAQQYQYKMVVNHDWGAGQIPENNSNLSFTVKTAGTYNVTFTLDMKDYALAADVQLVKADEQEQPQTFTGYIQPGIWDADGAKYAAWVWKAGNEGQWTAFATALDGTEVSTYAIDVPAHIDSLIFVRFKPETETPSWETEIVGESEQYVWIWNRTGSYGTPKAENCRTFVITDWDKGLWCGQEEEEEEETSEFHVYLQGSWNNWEGLHEFKLNEDTTKATLTMERLGMGTYEYQIVVTVGEDEHRYYNKGTMTRDNCTGWDFATDLGYGINAGLEADMDGAYTFNLVIDKVARTVKVSVTYPDNGQGGEQTETIYTLAGSKDLFGTEWDLTNEANDMVATAEANIYSLTKENVHLNAGTHTFRVYADRDFKGYQVPADHDQELVIKQAGTYNVTFTLNTNEHTLTAVPELLKADEQEQPQTFTGYIQLGIWDEAGAKFAAWVWKKGEEGQWTAFADAIDGTEVSTYAIDVPAHIDSLIFVRFKPETETPSWETEIVGESEQYVWIWNRTGSYGTPKAENCRTFVITDWDKGLWCGQEEEEEEETSEFHVYLQGSWNGWSGKHECTLNADTTQATLTMERLGMGTYEYQVVVTVGKDEYHFANKGTMTRDNCTGWDFATDLGYGVNAGLDADMDGAYTFNLVIDKVARTVKVSVTYPDNGETPEEDVYTVAGEDDLMGTDWNLDDKDNIMVKGQEEGIYTLTKENIHLDADRYEYKVFANHSWDGYQVPDKGNNELVIRVAGTYNVTFTLNTNEHSLTAEPELIKADPIETFTGFIQPGIWDADGAKYAAWVWKAGNDGQWTAFADAVDGAEENIYAIDVPAHIDSLIFVRFKPETETPSWETEIVGESEQYVWIWNRTGSYGTPKAENCRTFVITDWDKGLWCGQEEEEEEETSEFHVYLQGSWNNWEGKHECTLNADTTQATLTMERLGMGTYEYQVVVTVGKDEYHFANKGTMTRDNCTGWDFATDLGYGVNAGLDADMDGAYTFNLVIDKAALAINVSVTYPDNGQEEQTTTVYFVNKEDWETVYIYAWGGEGETFRENAKWPGVEMNKLRDAAKTGKPRRLVNGHAVYTHDLDNQFTNVIFNGGSDAQKTNTLTVSATTPYFYGDTWYAQEEDIPTEQQPELHVYLQGSWDNWEQHEFTQNLQADNATLALQLDPETYNFQIVLEYGGVQVYFYNTGTMTRDNCTGWNFDLVTEYGQNARLTADMTGTYTFTLTGDLDNNQVTLSVTYPDNQGSALEETTVSSELRKVMENGVLYIIRDGKKYNAQGAVVY